MQIKFHYINPKSTYLGSQVRQAPPFKGLSGDSLNKICNNNQLKERLDYYIGWYFEQHPNQLRQFLSDLGKVARCPDEFAFDALKKKFNSFGELKGVKDQLATTDGFRIGQVRAALCERLETANIRPKSIIDIGCGDGSILTSLKDTYRLPMNMTTGLDLFETKRLHPFNRLTYDGHNLHKAVLESSIKDKNIQKTYDVAVLASVLHHSDDQVHLLKEANKLLSDGGVLIIEDINPDKGFDDFHTVMDKLLNIFQDTTDSPVPANYINFDILKNLADRSGFKVSEIKGHSADGLKQFSATLKKT